MKKKLMLLCTLVCAVALIVAAGTFISGYAYSDDNKVTFTTGQSVDMTQTNWHYVQFGRTMDVYGYENADRWYIDTLSDTDLNSVNFDGPKGTLTWKVELPETASTFWTSLAIAGNGSDVAKIWISTDNTEWSEMDVDLPTAGYGTGYMVIDAHADLDDMNLTAEDGVYGIFVKIGIDGGSYGYRVRGRLIFSHDAVLYSSQVSDNLGLGDVYTTVEKGFSGLNDSAYLVYANGGTTDTYRFFDGTSSNGTDAADGQNRMDKIGVFHGIYKYTTMAGVKGLVLQANVAGHALLEIYTGDADISKANSAGAGATVLNASLDANTAAAIGLEDWVPLTVSSGEVTHTIDLSEYIEQDVAQTVYIRISDASDLNGGGGIMLGMSFTEYANMTAESYLYFNDDTDSAEIKAGESLNISQFLDPQLDFADEYSGTIVYSYEYKVTGNNAADASVTEEGVFSSEKSGVYTVEITLKASNTDATDTATFTVTVTETQSPATPETPSDDDTQTTPSDEEKEGGCGSSIAVSSLLAALVCAGGALLIVCKKKVK